jgi:hypothetical protein
VLKTGSNLDTKNGQMSCKLSRKPSHLGENLKGAKSYYYIFRGTKTNFELEIKEWSVGVPWEAFGLS